MVVKINNKVWQYSNCEYMKYMQNSIHIILHRENIKYINDKCKQLLMYFSVPPSLLGTRRSSLAWSHNHIFLPIGQKYGDLTMLFSLVSGLLETIMKTEVICLTVFISLAGKNKTPLTFGVLSHYCRTVAWPLNTISMGLENQGN